MDHARRYFRLQRPFLAKTGFNRFKAVQTDSWGVQDSVLLRNKRDVRGCVSMFYTWKMWNSCIFYFQNICFSIFIKNWALNWFLSLWLDGRVVLGWKARRPAETYQDPYIGEKSSNDWDKDISNICMLTT